MKRSDPPTDDARDMEWATGLTRESAPLADWIGMICNKMVEVDVLSLTDTPFSARWRRYGVGPVDLNFLQSAPQTVIHSPEMASRSTHPHFELAYMARGPCRIHHGRETLLVEEGHFVLLDHEKPFELEFAKGSICHGVHLEEAWLKRWIPHPHDVAAKSLSGHDGWGRPLAALLTTIEAEGIGDQVLPRAVIADQLGALLAMMFGKIAGPGPRTMHTASLLERAKSVMHDNFGNETLSPAILAAELGISKRYVHTLFARAGTTFGDCLGEIRLTQAATMLASKRFEAYRVCDIAWACGFSDPAYFARRFKQRFGAAPGATRRKMLAPGADQRDDSA